VTIARRVLAVAPAAGSALALFAVTVAVLSGCAGDPSKGYSFTSSYDQRIKTVAVPMFKNPTFMHGVEFELTDAIIKEIQRSTPWKVSPAGSTTLTGSITDARLDKLSTGRQGLAQELTVTLSVDFEWKDNATGKVLVGRRNFTSSEAFVPARPVGERIETGQSASVQALARDIVSQMRADW
jgi:hypothetical protein